MAGAFRQVIWPQCRRANVGPGCRVKVPGLRVVGWVPDGEVAAGRADDEQSVVGTDLPGLVVLVWVYLSVRPVAKLMASCPPVSVISVACWLRTDKSAVTARVAV